MRPRFRRLTPTTRLMRADLHVFDQPVLEQVDMLDQAVRDDITGQVTDHLMHLHHRAPGCVRGEADRVDVGIDRGPLARKVIKYEDGDIANTACHHARPAAVMVVTGGRAAAPWRVPVRPGDDGRAQCRAA